MPVTCNLQAARDYVHTDLEDSTAQLILDAVIEEIEQRFPGEDNSILQRLCLKLFSLEVSYVGTGTTTDDDYVAEKHRLYRDAGWLPTDLLYPRLVPPSTANITEFRINELIEAALADADFSSGVSEELVKSLIATALSGFSSGISETRVNELIATAIGNIETGITPAQAQKLIDATVSGLALGISVTKAQQLIDTTIAGLELGIAESAVARLITTHTELPNAHHTPPAAGIAETRVNALITAHQAKANAHHTPPAAGVAETRVNALITAALAAYMPPATSFSAALESRVEELAITPAVTFAPSTAGLPLSFAAAATVEEQGSGAATSEFLARHATVLTETIISGAGQYEVRARLNITAIANRSQVRLAVSLWDGTTDTILFEGANLYLRTGEVNVTIVAHGHVSVTGSSARLRVLLVGSNTLSSSPANPINLLGGLLAVRKLTIALASPLPVASVSIRIGWSIDSVFTEAELTVASDTVLAVLPAFTTAASAHVGVWVSNASGTITGMTISGSNSFNSFAAPIAFTVGGVAGMLYVSVVKLNTTLLSEEPVRVIF